MELIFLGCGIGTLVLLAAQMLDYLWQVPQPQVVIRELPASTGHTLQVAEQPSVVPATQYDQAA